jgi:hypothetical protein
LSAFHVLCSFLSLARVTRTQAFFVDVCGFSAREISGWGVLFVWFTGAVTLATSRAAAEAASPVGKTWTFS